MGLGLGSSVEEVREKLDPLRDGEERPLDGEKEEGERVYWKLKGTEYSWIIAWAGDDEKIVRMRAMLRPENSKPFSEIGDLAIANVSQPNAAVWNTTAPDGSAFRVVAQGADQHATSIYIFSLRRRD
jgi:hypothetical protein